MAGAHRGRRPAAVAARRRIARSSPRSSATASRGTARSCANRSAPSSTRRRSRGCARGGAVYECACTRRELEAAPPGAGGERVYPGTCRDGIPADRARPRAACVARRASATREHRVPRSAAGPAAAGPRARRRRFRRPARRRALRLPARRRRRRRAAGHHRTSCAAPTCSRRRRARSCCSACSATPPFVPARADRDRRRRREALQADARRAAARRCAARRCSPPGAFSTSRCPKDRAAPASVAEFWAWAIAAWNPARLPPVAMLPAPRRFEGAPPDAV